ncbi:ThiF family adenylyltransferase [Robertmurraya sp. FSL R5-0851]|uniref:ThiF family adenylyltransferase n=1 Tax=Robertmurraya sp. FSL R5-0851 TaxID=2921584 RepID=UPI0030F6C975
MTINILKTAKHNWYDYKELFPFIVLIGTGGTGGYVVQHIAQLLGTSKQKAAFVIADPDTIEPKNLGNQLFLENEVGLKKADVLASRYSAAYGLDIGAYSDSFVEDTKQLRSLFSTEYMDTNINHSNTLILPIVIGCVDNNFSRKIMYDFFKSTRCIYIDSGNESVTVPYDWRTRPQTQWTEEEHQAYKESGWSGQVVTGVNLNLFKQECIAEAFPDVLEDDDEVRPSELSCTDLSASDPQRLIVNKFAALAITNILTQIVEEKSVGSHITFFHAKRGYMRSTDVKA